MLVSHISFTLGLIALVAGVCLYLWSVRAEPGAGIGLAKVVGILVIILSVLSLIATVYSTIRMHNSYREITRLRRQTTPAPASPAVTQTAPANDAVLNADPANTNTTSMNLPVNNNDINSNNADSHITTTQEQKQ